MNDIFHILDLKGTLVPGSQSPVIPGDRYLRAHCCGQTPKSIGRPQSLLQTQFQTGKRQMFQIFPNVEDPV
jgi:hypothetical protein